MKKATWLLLPWIAKGTAFAESAAPGRWTNAFVPPVEYLLAIAGIALLIAFLVVSAMKASLKTAAHRHHADSYMRRDSFTLDRGDDLFLYETVERRQRQRGEGERPAK